LKEDFAAIYAAVVEMVVVAWDEGDFSHGASLQR
jgi:hypothetical protein